MRNVKASFILDEILDRWTAENVITFFAANEELDASTRLTSYHQLCCFENEDLMDFLTAGDSQAFSHALRARHVIPDLLRAGILTRRNTYQPFHPPTFILPDPPAPRPRPCCVLGDFLQPKRGS